MSRYVDEHRGRYGVEPICTTLGVSVSAYYERRKGRRSQRAVEDERLLGRIRELHAANYYAYGYRRMWKTLRRAGEQVPRCQVQRLMRGDGIVGAKRRGKPWRTTRPDPQAQRRPDLVQRDFAVNGPNELWVADLTYLRCWDGLVFFAFVLDAHSRMIVGWQLAGHMRTDLVLDALRMALHRREPGADVELIHHSDRGSQYTSIDYTQTLADHRVLASVGSIGDAYDNAARRVVCRQLQDRADPRPHLADPLATRARRRRVHRLVQHRPPAREPRRHPTARIQRAARSPRSNYARRSDRVNQQNRSPPNPVRLTPPSAEAQASNEDSPHACVRSSSSRPASSTATAVSECLCTSTPITIICIASKPLGATGERTDLNRGQRPRSYQVTLDGLGKAAATQHWQVGTNRQFRMESAAANPILLRTPDTTVTRQ